MAITVTAKIRSTRYFHSVKSSVETHLHRSLFESMFILLCDSNTSLLKNSMCIQTASCCYFMSEAVVKCQEQQGKTSATSMCTYTKAQEVRHL